MPKKTKSSGSDEKRYACPVCGKDFTKALTPATVAFWCGKCNKTIDVRPSKLDKKPKKGDTADG